ncbi:MAG: hypothetical protein ACR2I7_01340 [Geodermatophilaceae bacterium]
MPPTPEEVYEQFIVQPIPGLGFDVQPPDLGLVNLPEILYTTEPTSGTYTVDGGPSYAVPGTVTTTGPPRTIAIVEAHPVLTDPYD